uniref:Uncharacterized protein n=1 Tax=Pelusios castaneus TaxID=367368 RepID=A0A8C8SY17_9SAUR
MIPPDFPTFLLSCSLVVFPLYRSSKDTLENQKTKPFGLLIRTVKLL